MLVKKSELSKVIEKLSQPGVRAFDTETTGLRPWQGDSLFSLIISDADEGYYFNFQEYPELDSEWVLPRAAIRELASVFGNPKSKWYAHNAKFDMGMLAVEGIDIAGEVHCTEALGRVADNTKFTYTLDALASAIGHKKDDAVKEAIKKLKLYREEWNEEKQKTVKIPLFNKVPYGIITKYGLQDAKITFELGLHQEKEFSKIEATIPIGKARIGNIVSQERQITKTFFAMERRGILVDLKYAARAAAFEQGRIDSAIEKWRKATGESFVDSAKCLAPIFDRYKEIYPRTEKGNPSFTDDVLEGMKSPLAKFIQDFRDARKRCTTYYKNFIKFSDGNSVLHATARQGGTGTGRVSYADPNLQNLNKEEDATKEFLVRRSFVPRPGYFFGMIDYDQMEYRLMLEYAKQEDVIAEVLGGMDVHEATARIMSTPARTITRQEAKTINFMLLYGGGVAKLAMALFPTKLPERELKTIYKINFWAQKKDIKEEEREALARIPAEIIQNDLEQLHKAKALRQIYFDKLPRVKEFTSDVITRAQNRGYIVNWAGRVCKFPYADAAYKAPNYLIQGGCADVMKKAMLDIEKFLVGKKTAMLVQIHDELLFEVHESESDILLELQNIMASTYTAKKLPLTCGIDHSFKSWGDKIGGMPGGKENVTNGGTS